MDNSSVAKAPVLTTRGVKFNGSADVMTATYRTNFVAPATETFAYDDDGNLTSDGRWNYTWDAENRLIQMISKTYTGLPDSARKKLVFAYDYMGRRVKKSVEDASGAGYNTAVVTNFVYDGWNLLAELDAGNNGAVVCSYMWGSDLSGSLHGAGGVGGLLTVAPSGSGTHFISYDGNGNVAGLTDGSGNISARYEYSPFGQTIRVSGNAATDNPIRFSTKYTDGESGLCYYGYRSYNPSSGRWLSRDVIDEGGGANLYALVPQGNPLSDYDVLGMCGRQRGVASFRFVKKGWIIRRNSFHYKFSYKIKYKKGKEYDRNCCKYVQWVTGLFEAFSATDRVQYPTNPAGVPFDLSPHIDTLRYDGDGDPSPSGYIYEEGGEDLAGVGDLPRGVGIEFWNYFDGDIIDTCNGGRLVATDGFGISASGVFPGNMRYSPR